MGLISVVSIIQAVLGLIFGVLVLTCAVMALLGFIYDIKCKRALERLKGLRAPKHTRKRKDK